MDSDTDGSVLLLGEGDFSFSVALRKRLPQHVKMTSTAFLNDAQLKLHKAAHSNIDSLRQAGVEVFLGVDATKLENSTHLAGRLFSRIIFNFPHVGGKSNIKKNRQLLKDFFPSAVTMLTADGEIMVSLCKGQGGTPADLLQRDWPDCWQVVPMATYADLIMCNVVPFDPSYYEEYNSTGFKSEDRHFHTERALTHVFVKSRPLMLSPGHVEPGVIHTDTGAFHTRQYIANKLNKNLLREKNHPILQCLKYLQNTLESKFPMVVQSQCPSLLVATEDQVKLRHSQYCYSVEPVDNKAPADATTDNEAENLCIKTKVMKRDEDLVEPDNSEKPDAADSSKNVNTNGTHYHIRTSLAEQLKQIVDGNSGETVKGEGCLILCAGSSCHRCPVSPAELPVQNEMLGCLVQHNPDDVNKIKDILLESLTTVTAFSTISAIESKETVVDQISLPWIEENLKSKFVLFLHSDLKPQKPCHIPKGVDSTNLQMQIPAEDITSISHMKSDKEKPIPFGVVGTWKQPETEQEYVAFVIILDTLAQEVFDIPDPRLLWSESVSKFYENNESLSKADLDTVRKPPQFRLPSLYPTMWRHDICFWENLDIEFDNKEFIDILRDIGGDNLREVLLINHWIPSEQERSRTYTEIFVSCDRALSYHKSHDFQNFIRLTVADEMQVKLR